MLISVWRRHPQLTSFALTFRQTQTVITGFNTDIEFGGITYHVQTEDKGLSKPLILTLVYDGGTILASKRSPYGDLLKLGFDESVLAARLQKQHTLMCAAVRNGRIEELKQMTLRESAKAKAEVSLAGAGGIQKPGESFEPPVRVFTPSVIESPIPKPAHNGFAQNISRSFDEQPIDVIEISDEDLIFPDDAVEIISEPRSAKPDTSNSLTIELLGNSTFRGGDKKLVGLMVFRGSGHKVVREAQIMVKILGSNFRPLIFHARTDINGIARIDVQIPNFNSGRALFLIRAISDGEEIELRRPISHG